jgi:hypothetical protein
MNFFLSSYSMFIVVFFYLFQISVALSTKSTFHTIPLYTPGWSGPSPPFTDDCMIQHTVYLAKSYKKLTGKYLFGIPYETLSPTDLSQRLFNVEKGILLSHGIQDTGDGPLLNYGNKNGLTLWGATWDQLTSMPSKKTAEPVNQATRQAFLEEVTSKGYVDDYSGVRIGLCGSRFTIEQATVWNVVVDGERIGQAAAFDQYTPL